MYVGSIQKMYTHSRKVKADWEPGSRDMGCQGWWKAWMFQIILFMVIITIFNLLKIDGRKWKQWQIFLGSKIPVDSDCSHEIKRCLLLGRKAMTKLDSILISRDITLLTKVQIVKAMVFPVVMYGCESWTIEKTECWRTDAFELSCWRRLLRVPWTARRSNQSILKEISPNYSLQGLILKLKLQCFGHMMQRVNSLEKTLMLGKIEGRRRKAQQRMRWLDGIINSMNISLSKLWELVQYRKSWHATFHGVIKSQAWLSDWTTTNNNNNSNYTNNTIGWDLHCARHHLIISHNYFLRQGLVRSPLYSWRNWEPTKTIHLLSLTGASEWPSSQLLTTTLTAPPLLRVHLWVFRAHSTITLKSWLHRQMRKLGTKEGRQLAQNCTAGK